MASQNLGRVGLVLQGTWSSTTQYEKLDVVAYDGNSWAAKRSNKNVTPNTTNTDDWQLMANNADVVATVQGYKNDAEAAATSAAASATDAAKYNLDALANEANNFDATATYSAGEYVIYDDTTHKYLYRFTANHAAGAWTGTDAVKIAICDDLRTKANIDGSYNQMTVGNAEQLVSTVGVEDQAPYNFRTSGGAADIGDREVDKIVGGTIAWNQLLKNGDFATATDWASINSHGTVTIQDGVLTVTCLDSNNSIGIAQNGFSVSTLADHKVLFAAYVKPSADVNVKFGTSSTAGNYNTNVISVTANIWTQIACIGYMANNNTGTNFLFYVNRNGALSETDTVQIKNIMAIDLTQMFGSTIADYIYALETATTGAGVAWFRNLFPKDYYAYNAGELMSVQAASHKMVGFNAWDEEWELGYYGPSGAPVSSNGNIRSKNYIPVLSGLTYYIKSAGNAMYICQYDSNKVYINGTRVARTDAVLTTRSNCQYIRFNMAGTYGTTYNHDICISLRWDGERDGEYEPYTLYTYPMDDSLELRGIPKLDANNNLYYDGDTYESDGTVTRKYKAITLDGTTSYRKVTSTSLHSTTGLYYSSIPLATSETGVNTENDSENMMSDTFVCKKGIGIGNIYVTNYGGNIVIVLNDQTITTKEDVNNWLASHNVGVVYELATPTTESADPYQNPQIVNDWGTEEYVDAGVTATTPTRDVAIPVGHDTLYQANLRAKLEMAPDSPSDGNGDYIVRQTNGVNAYAKLVIPNELPTAPGSNGTYHLKSTVSGGSQALSWDGEIDKDVSDLKSAVGEVSAALRPETDLSSDFTSGKYIALDLDIGETFNLANKTETNANYGYTMIPCIAGDTFIITAATNTPDFVAPWAFVKNVVGNAYYLLDRGELTASVANLTVVAQENGDLIVNHLLANSYSLKMKRLFQAPAAPTANGTYVLTVAVSDGVPTYSWTAQS